MERAHFYIFQSPSNLKMVEEKESRFIIINKVEKNCTAEKSLVL